MSKSEKEPNTDEKKLLEKNSLSKKRTKVARNFIKNHGRSEFRRLLQLLGEGVSGQTIADEYDVSRERVRQWKNTFGDLVTVYRLHPEIEDILSERRNPS